MGAKTGIEWTDATWNPVRGCSRVSEGCRHCYAETMAYRFSGEGKPYAGLAVLKNGHASWTGKVEFVEKHLLDPLTWGPVITGCLTGIEIPHAKRGHCPNCKERSCRIFVNSMSDLFHENVTDEMRDRIFAVMALCPQHTFQVLTKRPERMLRYMTDACTEGGGLRIGRAAASLFHGMGLRDKTLSMAEQAAVSNQFEWKELKHVWLGVSVENQKAADERIPLLLKTPAAVRFISAEPLLGPVDLEYPASLFPDGPPYCCSGSRESECGCRGLPTEPPLVHGLDWIICGGESGPHARPMHPDWARGLRDQCKAAGVPFFFKQWGEFVWRETLGDSTGRHKVIFDDGVFVERVGKKHAGALLDGVEHKAFPAVQA